MLHTYCKLCNSIYNIYVYSMSTKILNIRLANFLMCCEVQINKKKAILDGRVFVFSLLYFNFF